MREGAFDHADLSSRDALFRFEIARDAIVVHADTRSRWVEWLTRTLIDHDDIAYHLPMLIAGVERAARAALLRGERVAHRSRAVPVTWPRLRAGQSNFQKAEVDLWCMVG